MRTSILQAAYRLVQRDGITHLTIDAVAHEAGLSKGGLRYHFPSKDRLIEGMVQYLLDDFAQDMERARIPEDTEPGAWLRAYIRACNLTKDEGIDRASSLLAAATNDPMRLGLLRAQYGRWQKQAEHDGIPPVHATIIRLALDGLWVADMFGLAPPTGTFREEVIAALLEMSKKTGDKG